MWLLMADHFKAIFHVDVESVLLSAKVCQSFYPVFTFEMFQGKGR